MKILKFSSLVLPAPSIRIIVPGNTSEGDKSSMRYPVVSKTKPLNSRSHFDITDFLFI